jgi:hypothetical protein
MQTTTTTTSFDQFTIGFVDMTDKGGSLAMWWEKTTARVSFGLGS